MQDNMTAYFGEDRFQPAATITDRQTDVPVYSPRISLDMMTVKRGAELFTVSANDTATFFRLIKPRTTVVNLERNAHKEGGGVSI